METLTVISLILITFLIGTSAVVALFSDVESEWAAKVIRALWAAVLIVAMCVLPLIVVGIVRGW